MSALAPHLPGARVLDLFAGSGALGLEALSRGAASATFVEQAPGPLRVLRANVAALGAAARAETVRADALRYAAGLPEAAFDLALADPPYDVGLAAALAESFLQRPFAALLCVEHRRDEPLPDSPVRSRRYGDTVLTFFRAS